MANINTSELLRELEAVLSANQMLGKVVVSEKVTPLVQEDSPVATYIQLIKVIPRLESQSPEMDGYIFHGMFLITLNVDCTSDKYLVYDTMDSLQRSLLTDEAIWSKLIDRDLIATEYDNAEFSPKRTATCVLEARYKLACN